MTKATNAKHWEYHTHLQFLNPSHILPHHHPLYQKHLPKDWNIIESKIS